MKKGMSLRAASKKYGIPHSTLFRKSKGGSQLATTMGAPTRFTKEQENILVKWIVEMARAGFPISKDTLVHSASKLAQEYNIKFGDGHTPKRKWYEKFMWRY